MKLIEALYAGIDVTNMQTIASMNNNHKQERAIVPVTSTVAVLSIMITINHYSRHITSIARNLL